MEHQSGPSVSDGHSRFRQSGQLERVVHCIDDLDCRTEKLV